MPPPSSGFWRRRVLKSNFYRLLAYWHSPRNLFRLFALSISIGDQDNFLVSQIASRSRFGVSPLFHWRGTVKSQQLFTATPAELAPTALWRQPQLLFFQAFKASSRNNYCNDFNSWFLVLQQHQWICLPQFADFSALILTFCGFFCMPVARHFLLNASCSILHYGMQFHQFDPMQIWMGWKIQRKKLVGECPVWYYWVSTLLPTPKWLFLSPTPVDPLFVETLSHKYSLFLGYTV